METQELPLNLTVEQVQSLYLLVARERARVDHKEPRLENLGRKLRAYLDLAQQKTAA